ncbi:MAG: tRNA-uridine aminocarboxypropyltransferase [Polyangiaceae bacterium]
MSRRHNAHVRCPRCYMHGSLCVCNLMPTLDTRTRLILVIHRIEARKPSNTGRLGVECLTNSETWIRGHEEHPTDTYAPAENCQPLFLFPHEEATPITTFANSERPIHLIVPDGTWRQAAKVRNRVAGFKNIPCVSLPADAPSIYRLRSEAHAHGLATIEAIARAFGILEGPESGPRLRSEIEHVFQAMVERTLWSRGEIETENVHGGIPEGAMRHDPRSGPLQSRRELLPEFNR